MPYHTEREWNYANLPESLFKGISLAVSPGRVESSAGTAFLEAGPSGQYGLSFQDKIPSRLTSAVDPAAEDLALVSRFQLDPHGPVLCLGLGLGYQVEELLQRLEPGVDIWIFESQPALAACAFLHRDLTHLLQHPQVHFFIGPHFPSHCALPSPPKVSPKVLPKALPKALPQTDPNTLDKNNWQILWRPSTKRHFASQYPSLLSSCPKTSTPKVLIFQSGYFLDREIKNAAQALGWETEVWQFKRGETASGENFKDLLGKIKSFGPTLVLTINHLGFDTQGLLEDCFTRLKIPVATWFVDSPAFILQDLKPGPGITAFSWDRDYLPLLKAQGFSQVHHLPLATDDTYFSPNKAITPIRPWAFVGDSLTSATDKYLLKLGLQTSKESSAKFLATIDQAAATFLNTPELLPNAEVISQLATGANLNNPENSQYLYDLAALITWRGSHLRRLEVLRALEGPQLTVAGDKAWQNLLKLDEIQLCPPLDYYHQLPAFYQENCVNLNITSAQMKTGLNQRIFDVPATGAFLLTDHREQLAEMFEPGQEVITYHNPEEARELAQWYTTHPQARLSITTAALHRVKQGHLYRHRLAELGRIMKEGRK